MSTKDPFDELSRLFKQFKEIAAPIDQIKESLGQRRDQFSPKNLGATTDLGKFAKDQFNPKSLGATAELGKFAKDQFSPKNLGATAELGKFAKDQATSVQDWWKTHQTFEYVDRINDVVTRLSLPQTLSDLVGQIKHQAQEFPAIRATLDIKIAKFLLKDLPEETKEDIGSAESHLDINFTSHLLAEAKSVYTEPNRSQIEVPPIEREQADMLSTILEAYRESLENKARQESSNRIINLIVEILPLLPLYVDQIYKCLDKLHTALDPSRPDDERITLLELLLRDLRAGRTPKTEPRN